MLFEIFLVSLPIVFNQLKFTNLSRLYLCWLPPMLIMWYVILGIENTEVVPVSQYDGLRFYLLAMSCIPYMLLDRSNLILLTAGILPSLLCVIFFDSIIAIASSWYEHEIIYPPHSFNLVRVIVSYLIISGCCISLNFLVSRGDLVNEKLMDELEQKNRVIRQQAEQEVHQLNQQLYANLQQLTEREFILNQSQRIAKIGSWEYSGEHEFVFWSDEMYNIFELDRSVNFKEKDLHETMWGEHTKILMDALTNLMQTGKSFDLTLPTRTPFGYTKWIRINAHPIETNKSIQGARGICHDITYYKESEELLRNREWRYRSLFEQASDFIFLANFKGDFLDVNESMCKSFGYSKSEFLNMKIETLIDKEQLNETPIRYKELASGAHVRSDRRMVRRDGTVIQVDSNVKKIQDDLILVIARDVTSIRQAQNEIKLNEAKFRSAFEYSPIGMTLVSLDGKWIQVNKEFCHIVGYQEDELLTMLFTDITHPDDIHKYPDFLEKLIRGEAEISRIEKRYIHKNGFIVWVYVNVSLIKDSEGTPLYFVSQIEDISERKAAEEKFSKAFDLSPDLMAIVRESDLVFVEVNKKVEDITGFTREEVVGFNTQKKAFDLWAIPQERETFFKNYFANKSTFIEAQLRRKDHTIFYASVAAQQITLAGENHLIVVIRDISERIRNQEKLTISQANLFATINNTETLIWSVDREYKLLTYNEPFSNYIMERYGIQIKAGFRIMNEETQYKDELTTKWTAIYLRALSGEVVSLEERRFDIDFQYSICPIIVNDKIIGVSAFATNITERKAHERDLQEANKKIGELKLVALRSVMSPHFIFNALNSIQYFIVNNDRLNAISHLSTFSKLIRSILTHSIENKIKLSDELDILKNYVQLERTRFANKFNFSLTVDPSIDVESIQIPSLLIQPYIENAILHGLYNKSDSGLLQLNIEQDGTDTITFEVMDNGIGREAAIALRKQNFPTHKSMGIKLTEERLKLINQYHPTALTIEDLHDETGPCGTRVLIRIKV